MFNKQRVVELFNAEITWWENMERQEEAVFVLSLENHLELQDLIWQENYQLTSISGQL